MKSPDLIPFIVTVGPGAGSLVYLPPDTMVTPKFGGTGAKPHRLDRTKRGCETDRTASTVVLDDGREGVREGWLPEALRLRRMLVKISDILDEDGNVPIDAAADEADRVRVLAQALRVARSRVEYLDHEKDDAISTAVRCDVEADAARTQLATTRADVERLKRTHLSPRLLELAAHLLDLAGDEFGNHGCNDLQLHGDFTDADREALALLMNRNNFGDRPPEAWSEEDVVTAKDLRRRAHDTAAMHALAFGLREMAKETP